jgi:two-component system, chemotaxis family, chemotaxis protein CheY
VTPIDFNLLRFLVIDDNALTRRVVRMLLERFGASDIYEADDGASGVEAVIHFMPDIVIADWVMPNLDGLELTRVIRQAGLTADPYVPIIMVSGYSEPARIAKALDAGVTQFLTKPISVQALYDTIVTIVANPIAFRRDRELFRARPAEERSDGARAAAVA